MSEWLEARRRAELVAVGAALSRQDLIRHREGNISCRLAGRRLLITPANRDKRLLNAPDLIACDLDGAAPAGASSELPLHRETYRAVPAVGAIVHAHPPAVLALAARGQVPDAAELHESSALIGRVAMVPSLPPGSDELGRACADAVGEAPVVVLAGHGIVAVGADLWEALARVELAEMLARLALERAGDGIFR